MVDSVREFDQLSYVRVWRVCTLLFWAYLGWESLSFGLEEFRDPERSIPRVYWGSFVIVAAMYVLLAAVSLGAASRGFPVVGAAGLTRLVGDSAFGLCAKLVMLLVICANCNAWVYGASRLIFSGGRDGILPAFLGRLNTRRVPAASLATLLACYLGTVVFCALGLSSVTGLNGLSSQNFLVLFVFAIVAYARHGRGWTRWPVSIAGMGAGVFLLSGFTWWSIYPALLMLGGYVRFRNRVVASPVSVDSIDAHEPRGIHCGQSEEGQEQRW
jgi:APA family basic amino acid/polyamine antiporter/amino acid efflux transporter